MAKTALIWGAGGGIGQALVHHLVGQGWQVYAAGRNLESLEGVAAGCHEADFARPFSVEQAALAVSQETTEVDWWVYAAGDITSVPVKDLNPEVWQRILTANLSDVYLAAHYSQALLAREAPLYILGAVQERMRLPGLSAYAAAKAGVEALADVLRKELRRKVVVARPGAVDTALWKKVPFRMPAHALTPAGLAERLLQAYEQGSDGLLDV